MTQALFREDPYQAETEAVVLSSEPRGIALDRTVFYPQGGGQSGDKGTLLLDDGTLVPIVSAIYDADRVTILHVPVEGAALPRPGARVIARIDWALRYKRMRTHTALHLLSVVAPYPVTGGSVGDAEGRLDFRLGRGHARQSGHRAPAERADRPRCGGSPIAGSPTRSSKPTPA